MPNRRGSQRGRRQHRESKRAERELLTDTGALRAARERLMVETAPMANMPTEQWERDAWGLSDE